MRSAADNAPLRQHLAPCTHFDGDQHCNVTPTNRYLVGDRCCEHTPAAVGGRAESIPDPALTLDGLRARAAEPSDIVITVGGVRV